MGHGGWLGLEERGRLASPAEHHVVEGDAEVGAGLQDLGELDGDADLLPVHPPLSLQADRLRGERTLRGGAGGMLGDPIQGLEVGDIPEPKIWGKTASWGV